MSAPLLDVRHRAVRVWRSPREAPRLTYFQSWWLYRGFFDIFSMMLAVSQ
jgi:hypothetical protein